MSDFILDTSVVMAWCLKDEKDDYSLSILDKLSSSEAWAPSLYPFEVVNVLWVAERRNRLTRADSNQFVNLLESLPINIDHHPPYQIMADLLSLGRQYALSAYDAAYLELAMRYGLPLATRDKGLKSAARKCGVALV